MPITRHRRGSIRQVGLTRSRGWDQRCGGCEGWVISMVVGGDCSVPEYDSPNDLPDMFIGPITQKNSLGSAPPLGAYIHISVSD